MGVIKGFSDSVGVHTRHDQNAIFVGGLSEFATKVAAIQKLCALGERDLTWVVGDDTKARPALCRLQGLLKPRQMFSQIHV